MTDIEESASRPHVLRPALLASIDRGAGARTTPLVTRAIGSTSFLNGITAFEPSAEIALHTHNCAESVVIIEGEAIVTIDGVEIELALHDTTFVPAGIPHRFRNASGTHRMRILWTYGSVDATRTIVATGETGRIDGEGGRR